MSKRKVYQVIGYLNTTVQIVMGDIKKRIEFRGGSRNPKLTYGQFVTSDTDIQKALEDHPLFKIRFKLIKIDGKRTEKLVVEISPQAKIKQLTELNANLQQEVSELKEGDNPADLEEKNKEIEAYKIQVTEQAGEIKGLNDIIATLKEDAEKHPEKEEEPTGPQTFPDVLNMQAARDVLVKTYGQQLNKLPNGAAVLNKAKELNVQFPNWKK